MPYLLIRGGIHAGQRITLIRNPTVLGRDPATDICIPGDAVSRKHATISRVGDRYFIEDGDGQGHHSRNHTFVNGEQVPFPERVPLSNGDTIRICDFVCIFCEEDRKPLPPGLRRGEAESEEENETSSSIEASIRHADSSIFLQTQPAERLKILLEVSNLLSRTLELKELWPALLDNLFRLFPQTEHGFVVLCEEKSGRLVTEYVRTQRPGEEANARFSSSVVRTCVEKLEAFLSGESGKPLPSSESAVAAPMRSLMCAPLWSHEGKPLGALQLDTQDLRRKFTPDDLKFLLGVASQASIAVANARLHQETLTRQQLQRDLVVARQVVASFQPLELPRPAGYEFFAHYEPAQEVGGDYYDFVPLPGGRLAVLLGDVAGKGVPAALIMVRFSAEAQAALLTEPDPAAAFRRLNRAMQQLGQMDRFITLVGAVLDPAAHTAKLVNAGHQPPLFLRPGAAPVEAVPRTVGGPAIGPFEDAAYDATTLPLEPGDCLLLFSDGVTEALDVAGRQFGRKGIEAALRQAGPSVPEVSRRVLDAVNRHAAGGSQSDDITLVCFGRILV
jgi:serine phosphatase RsbU (regulator of sigma subunit)/pSer/pThr/pTyr-binding forkhead associated (FHA) protein